MLKLIQSVAADGDEAYAELVIGFCIAVDEAAPDVCEGLMRLEAPSMTYALRNMQIPSRTSTLWCAEIYGLCDVPAVQNYTMTFPRQKKKLQTIVRPQPTGNKQPQLKVVHISDIHVDLGYTVGASTNRTEDICCYAYTADMAPGVTDYPAGPWGDDACDSPLRLSESMYKAIKRTVPDAAFTLFTGDLVEGREWSTTHDEEDRLGVRAHGGVGDRPGVRRGGKPRSLTCQLVPADGRGLLVFLLTRATSTCTTRWRRTGMLGSAVSARRRRRGGRVHIRFNMQGI
jgi:sphingomyelin phosphodiesterase